jgi:N-acetylglutamate synthase-like GNAT family acetyltransferase
MSRGIITSVSPFIRSCDHEEFAEIKKYISEFELDDRGLEQEQFLIALIGNRMAAFGRVRTYGSFSEVCSMGVLPEFRSMGLGKQMFGILAQKAAMPVYIVTIMPEYYAPFGFDHCNIYPEEIKEKLNYCTASLPVEEKYVVMVKND